MDFSRALKRDRKVTGAYEEDKKSTGGAFESDKEKRLW